MLPHTYRSLEGREGGTEGIPVSYNNGVKAGMELYDLAADVGGTTDVASANPEVVSALMKLVEGMLKVLLLGLEREFQPRIPLDHAAVPWLFRHGAYLRALQVRGQDGKTAYQRA